MKLVTEPKVYIVGRSSLISDEIKNWAYNHDFPTTGPEMPDPIWQVLYNEGETGLVEFAGRHCYRAFKKGRQTEEYIHNIIESDHGSVLEHYSVNFVLEGISRTLSHELVRHRVGTAISQESQRYVDAKDVKFVIPPLYLWLSNNDLSSPMITKWSNHCYDALEAYLDMLHGIQNITLQKQADAKGQMLDAKRRTEAARSLLPGCAETRLVWTANIRTLRHVFEKRGDRPADLEIRRLAVEIFTMLQEYDPVFIDMFFYDFVIDGEELGVPVLCRK